MEKWPQAPPPWQATESFLTFPYKFIKGGDTWGPMAIKDAMWYHSTLQINSHSPIQSSPLGVVHVCVCVYLWDMWGCLCVRTYACGRRCVCVSGRVRKSQSLQWVHWIDHTRRDSGDCLMLGKPRGEEVKYRPGPSLIRTDDQTFYRLP